jgi:hypothetical protein
MSNDSMAALELAKDTGTEEWTYLDDEVSFARPNEWIEWSGIQRLSWLVRETGRRVSAPSEETELGRVLDEIAAFIRRFVFFKEPRYADVLALWIAHTWAFDAATVTPYVWLYSPEMGSGKTRTLEVLELLVRAPWRAIEPTEAVLFRKIAAEKPTLLLDEVDVIFAKDRKGDAQAALRGIINAGNQKGAFIPRAEDFGRTLTDFPIFCPKALAGIGHALPATVVDRSIKVPMIRRTKAERGERFKRRDVQVVADDLRKAMQHAVLEVMPKLTDWREWRPDEELLENERAAEAWEPLFAIAETAGGLWYTGCRELAVMTQAEREVPLNVRLLSDCQTVFEDDGNPDAVSSRGLLESLKLIEGSPWSGFWLGGPGDQGSLARKLNEFGIKSKNVRVGDEVLKGYRREDFTEAWQRYVGCSGGRSLAATA